MKKLNTKMDHVQLYSKKLAIDNAGFEQHKIIINSQIKSSREIFANKFGKNFKKGARKYLRDIELI